MPLFVERRFSCGRKESCKEVITMLAYYGSRVSAHMTETPEGFLICHDVPIARTGSQEYLAREVGADGENMVSVLRSEAEVFAPAAIASFEGKPITDDHPPIQVTSENISMYARGHVQNVRRGSGTDSDLLLADLFITDAELIRAIKNGLRDVSCGYECEYEQDARGRYFQSRIRGNHVAVVAAGRAGCRVSIKDSRPTRTPKTKGATHMEMKKKTSLVSRLFAHWAQDADPSEVAEAVDGLLEPEEGKKTPFPAEDEDTGTVPAPSQPETPTTLSVDGGDCNQEIITLLKQVIAKLNGGASDAAPADPLQKLEQDIAAEDPTAAPEQIPADAESAQTIPAEEIGQDADPELPPELPPEGAAPTEPNLTMPGKPPLPPTGDSAGTLAAIRAVKPYLARLPERERRQAADSIARAVRQARGMNSSPAADGYAALLRQQATAARRRSSDSRAVSDTAYGRACAKRNPHNK